MGDYHVMSTEAAIDREYMACDQIESLTESLFKQLVAGDQRLVQEYLAWAEDTLWDFCQHKAERLYENGYLHD